MVSTGEARESGASPVPAQGVLFADDLPELDDEIGYRGPTACRAAGITYRQLDYWARTGLLEPSVRAAGGSGTQRLYGFRDILVLKIVKRLLDTGVSIMARPPGKRVTSISLLSGGEKALTAVALVFSIFRLNPAPFCLLDEVDAPLDEANVGRFCNMVAEMSERVQFLFVTHNKATMEAANQLCGVTMREPGVSRLVSVDLAEAAKLVGAA